MPAIPFAFQSYHRTTSLQPDSICRNLFVEKDVSGNTSNEQNAMLIQRPGLTRYQQMPANVRGFFLSENVNDPRLYTVAGDTLYAINGVTADVIGKVADDGQSVAFAPTYDKMAIVSGGKLYTYFQDDQTTGTFGQVQMPDDRQVIDIATLNSYIIIACADGRFYWLLPGTNQVGALDFLTAESSTDGLVGVRGLVDEMYFFGVSSVEVWQATGDLDIPFQRANGRNLNAGLLFRDTVAGPFDNTLMWVGTTGYVYRADSVPKRVSDPSVEERIANRTGPLSALVLTIEGHQFYCLKIPGQGTYCYDIATQKWCEFSTLGRSTWRPAFSVVVDTDTLVADDSSGLIWRVDAKVNTDDGTPMERVATGIVTLPPKPERNNSFSMDVGSSGPCRWRLRWHDAVEDDYPTDYQYLTARKGNDRITLYRLGQARGQYRTFEISILDDVRVRFGDAAANEAFG